MLFKVNFGKNVSKEAALDFLKNADSSCNQLYSEKGYILLDYILDGMGIRHKPFGLVGFGKFNPYCMSYEDIEMTEDNRVKSIIISLDARDYNDSPNIDSQFVNNKMALRGATKDELQQMDALLSKYFPKGLMQ